MQKLYKFAISPIIFALFGAGCRYTPTCSAYADEAIKRFGLIKGGVLALKRISRCHPYHNKTSYFDPVPKRL